MRLLDDQVHARVYDQVIRPVLFEDVAPSASPRAVIVGGQPGAGKSATLITAARELNSGGTGVAFLNGDDLRPFHPHYQALIKADQSTAADRTGADVGLWIERGIREAAAGRFSAVIETTMRQPLVVVRTAQEFHQAGHQVELRVLVVHPELSRLAIFERFAKALATPGAVPRFTLASYHEDSYARAPETLRVAAPHVDKVSLVDRSGALLQAVPPASAADALEKERACMQLTAEQLRHIRARWHALCQQLDRVGMPEVVREGVRAERDRSAASLDEGTDLGRLPKPPDRGGPAR